jgi:hypothetical protein
MRDGKCPLSAVKIEYVSFVVRMSKGEEAGVITRASGSVTKLIDLIRGSEAKHGCVDQHCC